MSVKRAATKRTAKDPVIVDPSAMVSPLGQRTLAAFRVGVEKELGRLARKRIATVVTINGKRVVGVPKRVADGYIIVPRDNADITRD